MFHVEHSALPIFRSPSSTTPLSTVRYMDACLLTISDAAKRLSTSERHLRELIYRRQIPFLRVGRLIRFDSSDLDTWVESRKVAAND